MRFLLLLAMGAGWAANAQIGDVAPAIPLNQDSAATATGPGSGFHPWLAANGLYRRIFDGYISSERPNQFDTILSGGASGWKSWGMKRLAASYSGSATHRSQSFLSSAWSQGQAVTLEYQQQLSQRFSYSVSELGGITYGGYGYGSSYGTSGVRGLASGFGPGSTLDPNAFGQFGDFARNGVVDGELLSGKIKFSVTNAGVSYRLSRRWMASANGNAALVRREGGQYSQDSYGGGGSLGYALSERSQMGGQYSYGVYRYPRQFGGAHNQTAMLNGRVKVTKTATLSGAVGAGMMESNYIGRLPIDPALGELLGSDSILQVLRRKFSTPTYQANYVQQLEKGYLFTGASRSFSAGNGVLQAGVRDNFVASFSRTLNPRIGLTWTANYDRLSSRMAIIGTTTNVQGAVMMSWRLFRSLSFTSQGGMRYLSMTISPSRREAFAGFGLAWMPGEGPFTF